MSLDEFRNFIIEFGFIDVYEGIEYRKYNYYIIIRNYKQKTFKHYKSINSSKDNKCLVEFGERIIKSNSIKLLPLKGKNMDIFEMTNLSNNYEYIKSIESIIVTDDNITLLSNIVNSIKKYMIHDYRKYKINKIFK